ncbi:hypothetical protein CAUPRSCDRAFT_11339, partial [Caulochytrium protostelioides]
MAFWQPFLCIRWCFGDGADGAWRTLVPVGAMARESLSTGAPLVGRHRSCTFLYFWKLRRYDRETTASGDLWDRPAASADPQRRFPASFDPRRCIRSGLLLLWCPRPGRRPPAPVAAATDPKRSAVLFRGPSHRAEPNHRSFIWRIGLTGGHAGHRPGPQDHGHGGTDPSDDPRHRSYGCDTDIVPAAHHAHLALTRAPFATDASAADAAAADDDADAAGADAGGALAVAGHPSAAIVGVVVAHARVALIRHSDVCIADAAIADTGAGICLANRPDAHITSVYGGDGAHGAAGGSHADHAAALVPVAPLGDAHVTAAIQRSLSTLAQEVGEPVHATPKFIQDALRIYTESIY